jgi:formylglycine-generating enzyme required for sulfatase activity
MQCPHCQAVNNPEARFCAMCGRPLPAEAPARPKVGDVGYIGVMNIGTEKAAPAAGGDYCPICGIWVKQEDSFRCRVCGRPYLHREHRDAELNMCSECAEKVRPKPPVKKARPAVVVEKRREANEWVIPLATGVEMTYVCIPAGTFLMGSADGDKDASDHEKPQHKVHLEEYWIGKTPVTNAQYSAFLEATGHRVPWDWKNDIPPKAKQDHPVVSISWQEARDFCAWAGDVSGENIRLPSEAEWEKAARGTDGRKYPWGNQDPDVERCNYDENIGTTTRVGRYSPQGDSPYGCQDMAGNVMEWTSSLWGQNEDEPDYKYPYRAGDGREYPESKGKRVVRGGSWYLSEYDLASACRAWHNSPSATSNNIGFRCSRLSQ